MPGTPPLPLGQNGQHNGFFAFEQLAAAGREEPGDSSNSGSEGKPPRAGGRGATSKK
jgi:hypothetical protein